MTVHDSCFPMPFVVIHCGLTIDEMRCDSTYLLIVLYQSIVT